MAKARNVDQLSLGLPGLYEAARPPRELADVSEGRGYHWRIGSQIPTLGAHSVAKHEIFERYIEAYISTLTKSHHQTRLKLTIVDGFCGGGRYRLLNEEVDGSPLRMLHAVERAEAKLREARTRGFVIEADFIFVDQKKNIWISWRISCVRGASEAGSAVRSACTMAPLKIMQPT